LTQAQNRVLAPAALVQNNLLTAAAAQVVSQSGRVTLQQVHDLITHGVEIGTAISLAVLIQNYNLMVDDLVVLTEMEPA
jgi:hypothetical protein